MTPWLKSITVADFRSIRGQVTVPLDAPIVLLHGQNGVGKTSILSAIELGLTGSVPSLGRVEPEYISHLPHKSAKDGRVSLTVDGLDGPAATAEMIVTREGIRNSALLNKEQCRFFSERSYLAQATLGRLLEIYQHQDTRKSDSPLTTFVKDLLGLDRLDALIDGLHPVGNVSRLRTLCPLYWNARTNIPLETAAVQGLINERGKLDAAIVALKASLAGKLARLNQTSSPLPNEPDATRGFFGTDAEEANLVALARIRRNLQATADQWRAMSATPAATEQRAVETSEGVARAALDVWRNGPGAAFGSIVVEVQKLFPDIALPSDEAPETVRASAEAAVNRDLSRCRALLSRDAVAATRLANLSQSIEQGRARVAILDSQIGTIAGNAEGLAKALANLVPHIHSEDCPVCGRDYREISSTPLKAHVSNQLAALTENAGRLGALSVDKANTAALIANAERERNELAGQQLAPNARDSIKTRQARLEELSLALASSASVVKEGGELIQRLHSRRGA